MRRQRFAERVWDRLEELTGSTVFYLDGESIAAYCPVCREGTIRVRFIDQPREGFVVTSYARPGHCSHGCTEELVAEVMRS